MSNEYRIEFYEKKYPKEIVSLYYHLQQSHEQAMRNMYMTSGDPQYDFMEGLLPDWFVTSIAFDEEYFKYASAAFSEVCHVALTGDEDSWDNHGKHDWCRCEICVAALSDVKEEREALLSEIANKKIADYHDARSVMELVNRVYEFDPCYLIAPPAKIECNDLHSSFEPILVGGGRKKRPKQNKIKRERQLVMSRVPREYAPTSMIVVLTYVDDSTLRNNVGNNFVYWRIQLNCPFDPDPLLLTGAVSGFTEWANIYRRYVVLSTLVESTIINNEAFPIQFNGYYTDYDHSTSIVNRVSALNAGETLSVRSRGLSASGGLDRYFYVNRLNFPSLTGQRSAYTNSMNYSSLVNSNPSTAFKLYWNSAATADSNFIKGVTQLTRYRMKVLFTERQTLLQ